MWFAHDKKFDSRFCQLFLATHVAASGGDLQFWTTGQDAQKGSLALLLLLDQFPRNAFRGTPRAFATDDQALALAKNSVDIGLDSQVEPALQPFFYMPFMHSESLLEQDRCVRLCEQVDNNTQRFARMHRDIIARFGRFPHRNAILGRTSTPEEKQFLQSGGFAG